MNNDNSGKIVKIKLYNETGEINVKADESILQAAMNEGLDPPFSCQLGVCATCKAHLISGKVAMDERDALTDEEINDGFILTCQSHPLTDDCFTDYDI
ncbi:MAG: 2Fe-2S iron-sulfur cluster-binding protein [Bacteroidota bacterium]